MIIKNCTLIILLFVFILNPTYLAFCANSENTNIYHHYNYCPNCGYTIQEYQEFCRICGERIIYYDRNKLIDNLIKENESFKENNKHHLLVLGFKYYNFDYKEELPLGYKSTELGWLPGVFLICDLYLVSIINSRFLIEFTDGKTKYDGTTQSGIPVQDKTRNNFLTLETDLEFSLKLSSVFYLNFYSGIGYRYWFRGGSEKENYAPYSEDYSWFYVPIGIKPIIIITDSLTFLIDFTLNIMFNGKIKVNLTEIDSGYNSPEADLGSKIGFKIGTSFNYNFYQDLLFLFNPWYEYSAIKKSNIFVITYNGELDAYGYEPSSTTHQFGINLGIGYQF